MDKAGFSGMQYNGGNNIGIGMCKCYFDDGFLPSDADPPPNSEVVNDRSGSGPVTGHNVQGGEPELGQRCYSYINYVVPVCTITEGYSDGSAGDLIIDANGNLSLNGNTNDPRFFDSTTLGTAHDAITTFENINNFIIAAGQIVNVLGTLIVKAKRTQIDGTLNGTGGGYAGGARRTSFDQSARKNGSGPGSGQGGYQYTGGAGAGHGKLIHLLVFHST